MGLLFSWPIMLIGTFVFAFAQIEVFRSIPKGIRNILCYWPLLGFAMNLASGCVISIFTGTGTFVGFLNVTSSIFVSIWILMYKNYHKLTGFKVKRFLLVLPYVSVIEENPTPHWLF